MNVTSGHAPPAPTRENGARVLRVPPPLYYAVAFAAAMLLRSISAPLTIGARPITTMLGAGAAVIGAALSVAGVAQVVRHRTTIVPHRAVSTLVTTGVYRLSRNPMYTGLAVAYLGIALLTGTWWPLVTLPLALLVVRRAAIDPEERYLADRFDTAYTDYRTRTRRWL